MSPRPNQLKQPAEAQTSGLHEITIGTKSCSIGKFSAIEGWKLIHKMTKAAGPMIGSFGTGDFSRGIQELLSVIDEAELVRLIKQLTSICLIDGKKISDADLGDYALILELCGEVIKHNFGDFFSQILDALSGFGPPKTERT